MKKILFTIASISIFLTIFFAIVYRFFTIPVLLSLAITSGTTSFHIGIRLLVGSLCDCLLQPYINVCGRWFRVSRGEQLFYTFIKVKKWKHKLPTYAPSAFNIQLHTKDKILHSMCNAELVHEINILCSFIPLLFSLIFGAFWAFFITSFVAAFYDLLFVFIQRFNRPRIEKLL